MRPRSIVGVLQALEILTPENLERLRASAEKTGAARVIRAVVDYQEAADAYKRRRARPLELARCHVELMQALEQNADELRGVAGALVKLFRP